MLLAAPQVTHTQTKTINLINKNSGLTGTEKEQGKSYAHTSYASRQQQHMRQNLGHVTGNHL
jgi:hypothetical protein